MGWSSRRDTESILLDRIRLVRDRGSEEKEALFRNVISMFSGARLIAAQSSNQATALLASPAPSMD